ncbi:MAG: cation:proton antiporter [Gemmatimonadota bacterium]
MHSSAVFLQTLALVLGTAALTTVIFHRLRQPVVFGYLIAGLLVGPSVPLPIAADPEIVHTLSELGVILLMFALGLDFSLGRVLQIGVGAGLAALGETTLMMGIGFLVGHLLGWTTIESLFTAGIVAISSTTIISKAFVEQRIRGRITEIVFGILIVEDLIAILLVAVLTAVAAGGGLTPEDIGLTVVRLATFLIALVSIGLLAIPRFMRLVIKLGSDETTLVAAVGVCFACAFLALSFGYSVALGAFIAGSLVAESGEGKAVEHLVHPVRDMFVAIFFVSVGMLIDPAVVMQHWVAVLVLALVVIVGKVVAVSVSTFLTGKGLGMAVQSGMTLAQVGEFSFIIAAIGLANGATRSFLYPIAVAVSALTTLTTPWLIRAASPVTLFLDRKLPARVQTFAALYGTWVEQMRRDPVDVTERSRTRRLMQVLFVDAALLLAIVIGAAAEIGRIGPLLERWVGIDESAIPTVVTLGAVALAVLPLVGIARTARQLGYALAIRAMPAARIGLVDFAAAPRSALLVTLQIAIMLSIIIPLVAITQPFVTATPGLLTLAAVVLVLGVAFWRSAQSLHGHTRAGAEAIVALLGEQMTIDTEPDAVSQAMAKIDLVLPGLGTPVAIQLGDGSAAIDHSLASLNLRGRTGATVLAIVRAGEQVLVPRGRDVLRAGDVLAVAGSADAVAAARALIDEVREIARVSNGR